MNKFKIGDKVRKNPTTWIKSEFDTWGAGEGIGEIIEPPFDLDSGEVDVVWPTGRAFQQEEELLVIPQQKVLIISGKKQAGKNTLSNFVKGLVLLQNGLIDEFKVSEETEGKLFVRDKVGEPYYFENFHEEWASEFCYPYVKIYAFADEVKRVMTDLFLLSEAQINGSDEDKNTLTKYRWEDMVGLANTEFAGRSGLMTARQLIQYFATEILRKISPDIHILATLDKIKHERPDLAVIEGCRFPNEVATPKNQIDLDIKIVRLTRTLFPADKHSSEISLDKEVFPWSNFDLVIDNDNLSIEETCRVLFDRLKEWKWVK